MIGRRAVVRRRPLLRTAAIGGGAYGMGRRAERSGRTPLRSQGTRATTSSSAGRASPGGRRPGPSAADQLSQLSTLHQQGALSDDEFAAAKAKILGS